MQKWLKDGNNVLNTIGLIRIDFNIYYLMHETFHKSECHL